MLMQKTPVQDPRKILIIRLSAIGDVARTLPALRALRKKFPAALIAWVVEDSSADLLHGHPDLNRVFVFKRSEWKKNRGRLSGLLAPVLQVAAVVRAIRSEHFDLVLDFHGILKSGLVSLLSGVTHRAGFSRSYVKEANHLFNTYHVDVETAAISRIERNLRFIRFLGIDDKDRYDPVIPVTEADRIATDSFLKEHGLTGGDQLIVIHPGTSRKTLYKRWDPAFYAMLADRLIADLKAKIIWTWGPGELETVQSIVGRMRHASVVAGRVTLTRLAELFRRAALFVGSDSGPMHIACFVQTPSVVMYGPTDPVVNAPYQYSRFIMLRKNVSCNPCRQRDCSRADCMAAITPDEVYNAAVALMCGEGAGTAEAGTKKVMP
jgi:3-deoxy-D-manno-octulosonic-acid transferase/heptosyltransferase-1